MKGRLITTDHEEIRSWAEERGGSPGVMTKYLGIDFPGHTGRLSMDPITWKKFFEQFEEQELALLYQDETRSGKTSRSYRLVKRPPEIES